MDCKTFKLLPTVRNETLKSILSELEAKFETELSQKHMTVIFDMSASVSSQTGISVDWRVFKSNFFHLLRNAIKHGRQNSVIKIQAALEDDFGERPTIAIRITNLCDVIKDGEWEKNMVPIFSFQKAGYLLNLDFSVGIGIGLSTVNALTNAVGGEFWIETDEHVRSVAAIFKMPRHEQVNEMQINTN